MKKKRREAVADEPEKSLDDQHLELLLQIFEIDRLILKERELPITIGVGERNVGITINPDFTWEWAPLMPEPQPEPTMDHPHPHPHH